jgi:hypothetical protein
MTASFHTVWLISETTSHLHFGLKVTGCVAWEKLCSAIRKFVTMPDSPNTTGPETNNGLRFISRPDDPPSLGNRSRCCRHNRRRCSSWDVYTKWSHDARAAAQDRALSDANAKNNQLSGQVNDLKRGLDGLSTALKSSDLQRQSLEGEVEFLNRYLSYLISPGDASKALFTNLVCALWKESEKRRVKIGSTPLDLSREQIQTGLSPDIVALLGQHGS